MSRSVEPNLAFGIDFQSSHFCDAGTVRLVSSEETLSFPFIGSIFTKQVQFSKANMLEWSSQELNHYKMVRISKALLKEAGTGLSKTLSEILVCPLTKQPLRVCEETNSLISDSIGVSFPIKDGIPSLVPKDGKILGVNDDQIKSDAADAAMNKE